MVFLQGSFVWDVLAVIEQNIKWKAWLDSATDNKGQRSNKKKKVKCRKTVQKEREGEKLERDSLYSNFPVFSHLRV